MDVACPNCATRFRIPDGAIGEAGRMVRCSKCEHTWHQDPPQPESPEPEPEAPEPEVAEADEPLPEPDEDGPIRPEVLAAGGEIDTPPPIGGELVSERERRKAAEQGTSKSSGGLTAVLWILLLLVVAGSLAGAWYKRDWIMANYPASEAIYARLGLVEVPGPPPLEIRDVKSVKRTVDGERRYIISGVIENTSDEAHPVPPMRGLILGEGGSELVRWDFTAGVESVAGSGTASFETSVAAPEGAQNLTINFVLDE